MPIPEAAELTTGVHEGADVARKVVLGGVQRAGGFIALNVVTAAAAVLLLRYLGVDRFGQYGTVMALMTIVQGISDAGLSMTGARELSMRKDAAAQREMLGHLLSLRIILTSGGVLIAIAFATVAGYSSTLVEGTALAGIGVILLSVQSALLLPLVVDLENWRLAINDVLRQAVLVGCFVVLAVVGAPLLPFFGASVAGAAVVVAITPLLLRGRALARPIWAARPIRELAIRALPLAISGVLSVLYFRVLVVLMSLVQGSATQLGFYVTSSRVIEIFLNLPVMLVSVALPVLSVSSRDNVGRLQYVTFRMTQVMAVIGVLLALVLSTGAQPVLQILGGAQYISAAPVLRIQALAVITIFVVGAWTTTLVGMGRTRHLAIATLIGVLAVVIAGTILIAALAALGAAIAAVVADLIFAAAVFVYIRRENAASGMRLRPFALIAGCAVPGVVIALVSPAPALVNTIIAASLYIALIWVAGATPPEIADRIAAAIPALRLVPRRAGS